MRTKRATVAGILLVTGVALPAFALPGEKRTWDFEGEASGRIARGFTGEAGDWKVVTLDKGQALGQLGKSPGPTFNVALVEDPAAKDVVLSVRMEAVAGEIDQGGGLVWRAKDAKNYYVARYNPLEENYRLYTVVDGERTMLRSVDIKRTEGWHRLVVMMRGDQIECFYDGQSVLEVKDTTFPGPGKVGLWTKADAQTHFDNLTVETFTTN
jgi:hypothetical protein